MYMHKCVLHEQQFKQTLLCGIAGFVYMTVTEVEVCTLAAAAACCAELAFSITAANIFGFHSNTYH
jgi:hypothetical protein